MDESYAVYPDKVRTAITITAFGLITILFFAVAFVHTWLVLKIFAVGFGIGFAYLVYMNVKYLLKQTPDYVIDEVGITDRTGEKPVTIAWEDMLKIEMAPNNSVMQIGILAHSAVADQSARDDAIKDNLAKNGNLALYSVMIDGFKYRRKPFEQMFKELQTRGVQHNPEILVTEYIDPETKRKLADKHDAEVRAARKLRKRAKRAKI